MYNGQLISIKKILWKVFNNPLAESLNYEDAAEYAIEALRLIGAPLVYIQKNSNAIELVNYKAALPANIINIRGIKLLNGDCPIALRRATDLYHPTIMCDDTGPSLSSDDGATITSPYDEDNQGLNVDITTANAEGVCGTEYTYTAQAGIVQTSVKSGEIIISYTSLACDEDGFPLVPDNEQVRLCLEYYILFRFLEPLWLIGKVSDKAFNYIDQKKCFYMGASNTSMQLQSGDHLESVMNAINRIIINDQAFDNFYKGTGQKERIKRYN